MMFSTIVNKVLLLRDLTVKVLHFTWFNISVNNVARVDVVQGGGDTRHVEGHIALLEQQFLLQVVSQVTAGFQVQNQVTMMPDVVVDGLC